MAVCGVFHAHIMSKLGYKGHAGADVAQYMCDRHEDMSFAMREVLRHAATPTTKELRLNTFGKYLRQSA